jgi:hypothetical protein
MKVAAYYAADTDGNTKAERMKNIDYSDEFAAKLPPAEQADILAVEQLLKGLPSEDVGELSEKALDQSLRSIEKQILMRLVII